MYKKSQTTRFPPSPPTKAKKLPFLPNRSMLVYFIKMMTHKIVNT
jgi:hypothetical protein